MTLKIISNNYTKKTRFCQISYAGAQASPLLVYSLAQSSSADYEIQQHFALKIGQYNLQGMNSVRNLPLEIFRMNMVDKTLLHFQSKAMKKSPQRSYDTKTMKQLVSLL